jgi:hypothetical protein
VLRRSHRWLLSYCSFHTHDALDPASNY